MLNRKTTILTLAVLALFCSRGGKDIAGTTTETQTGTQAAIEGLIVYGDSITPVYDAAVILHDQSMVSIITLGKRTAVIRSGNTTTNINGFFRFDSVDTGRFLIEVNDHDTLGGLFKAQVKPKDTLVEVNGVLNRLGCILGRVDTSLSSQGASISVYLPEIGREVPVDSGGYFTVSDVPAWNYQLRFVVNGSIVRLPADTIPVPVTAGDTTQVVGLGSKTGGIVVKGKIIELP